MPPAISLGVIDGGMGPARLPPENLIAGPDRDSVGPERSEGAFLPGAGLRVIGASGRQGLGERIDFAASDEALQQAAQSWLDANG